MYPFFMPTLFSLETSYFIALSLLMIVRTWLSSLMADIAGKAAGLIVGRRLHFAVRSLSAFIALTVPAAYVNSFLKYFTNRLSQSIRVRMTGSIHELYLQHVVFYNVMHLSGDKKIEDVAERLTGDIEHFSDEVSSIFTRTFKPLMDIVFFTYKLSISTTWRGPFILYSYFILASILKSVLSPPLGKLAAQEAQLVGEFRSIHERIITHSEEVAFFDGSSREKSIINHKLKELDSQVHINSLSRLFVNVIDNVVVKYWATLAGYIAIFSPLLFGQFEKKSATELAEDYARNTRYLTSLSQAIGSIVLIGNRINEIKAHVERIGEVISLLQKVSHHKAKGFKKVTTEPIEFTTSPSELFLHQWKKKCDGNRTHLPNSDPLNVGNVKIIEGDTIQFSHIDVVSPDGKVLVEDLSFIIKPHNNVMVTGPNGCGKSSLFRIIGELWPPSAHHETDSYIIKPKKKDIVFIPQKTYLVLGTLRDQIIYPHSKADMMEAGVTDEELAQLLKIVDPKEIILNSWKLDDKKDWFHALSGGQKQRIAMARLFYHCPKFAILDECTSSISSEVEDIIYESASVLGITLFTVSHRNYLSKHHDYILTFLGKEGKWHFQNAHK
uniref:ABC transporter domain-containing protein n=1 Tax=Arcella intermedia TaxID=1963864 RepID=A0A6B2L035_9EUKA